MVHCLHEDLVTACSGRVNRSGWLNGKYELCTGGVGSEILAPRVAVSHWATWLGSSLATLSSFKSQSMWFNTVYV